MWKEICGNWEFDDVESEPSEEMSFLRLLGDIQREEKIQDRKQKTQDET